MSGSNCPESDEKVLLAALYKILPRKKSFVTKETYLLCITIAYAVRHSRDEKDVLQRLCHILELYNFQLSPSELAAEPYDDSFIPSGEPAS